MSYESVRVNSPFRILTSNLTLDPLLVAVVAKIQKSKKIAPPPGKEIYNGAFVADDISPSAIGNYERKTGQKLDIALKFLAFATGLNFPRAEAETVAGNGGSIFIKLEPWSWKGKDDQSFSLQNLLNGDYDRYLENFARGCKQFGKPIFLSFGHEMNGNWYPWSGDPELYKKAYRYVHDKLAKMECTNITWVWNPNIDFGRFTEYYPGDKYVDWVGLDAYNTEDYGGNWRSPEELYGPTVAILKQFGKPIMIGETACDANDANDESVRKPKFLRESIDWMANNGVKAFIYFNVNKTEGGQAKQWALDKDASIKAIREAMQKRQPLFDGSIRTEEEEEEIKTPAPAPQKVEPPKPPTSVSGLSLSRIAPSPNTFNGGRFEVNGNVYHMWATNASDPGLAIDFDGSKIRGKKTMVIKVTSLKTSGAGRPLVIAIKGPWPGEQQLRTFPLKEGTIELDADEFAELVDNGFNKLNIMLANGGEKGSIDVKFEVYFK